MPNHWHLVVWPRKDGELSRFVGWLTLTHTQRWHAHRHSTGSGHVYQGRFKSFPVEEDEHFLRWRVMSSGTRCGRAWCGGPRQWRWGSLFRWLRGSAEDRALLAAWPLPRKANWVEHVNAASDGRPSWPRCVAACNAAAPSATTPGATARSAAWAWNRPSAPKADPEDHKNGS